MVGDLAQFMVQNELDEHSLVEQAGQLNFPQRYVINVMTELCTFSLVHNQMQEKSGLIFLPCLDHVKDRKAILAKLLVC